jgi:hypothetical protein
MSKSKSYRWPEVVILAATFLLFRSKDLLSFLGTKEFAGRDLIGNYAFTWLMQQNLLHGEIFSWTNQWLLGFPSFQLYPPLFFLFTSLLDLITGQLFGLQFWFKTVIFLSVFLLPLLTYLMMKKTFGKLEAFFAGFYMLFFLFVYPPISEVYQVFSVGLVAQGFAFFLLIVSIGTMLREGKIYKTISGVFLGLTTITHPFVAIAGFLFSASLAFTTYEPKNAIPVVIGGLISAPWILNAMKYLPYTASYTFQPANTGIFLYILLPLIIFGGYRGAKRKAMLATFFGLLSLSIIEFPLITQELRFYTYSLGIGSILAGFGAYRAVKHLDQELKMNKNLIAVVLLIPVISLSLHADLEQSWSFEDNADPVYEELRKSEKGRVLVETSNSSIFDSFVLQGKIPLETKHWAVNDVHLDSSTSANYILTLESWISEEPLYNPICRTCSISAAPSRLNQRLDDLGVRYAVARTSTSRDFLRQSLDYRGRYGEYWLFENKEGHKIVESLEYRPIALIGNYEKWKSVNDLLFVSNSSKEVVWSKDETEGNYSKMIKMQELSPEEVLNRIQQAELKPIPETSVNYNITDRRIETSSSGPIKVKISSYPGAAEDVSLAKFNTVVINSGGEWKLNR